MAANVKPKNAYVHFMIEYLIASSSCRANSYSDLAVSTEPWAMRRLLHHYGEILPYLAVLVVKIAGQRNICSPTSR